MGNEASKMTLWAVPFGESNLFEHHGHQFQNLLYLEAKSVFRHAFEQFQNQAQVRLEEF